MNVHVPKLLLIVARKVPCLLIKSFILLEVDAT
jgi:hypothetical protein